MVNASVVACALLFQCRRRRAWAVEVRVASGRASHFVDVVQWRGIEQLSPCSVHVVFHWHVARIGGLAVSYEAHRGGGSVGYR